MQLLGPWMLPKYDGGQGLFSHGDGREQMASAELCLQSVDVTLPGLSS